MKRPSRRLRESVTTMLKNGRFFAPPRASRMMTIALSRRFRKKTLIIRRKWPSPQAAASPQTRKAAAEPAQHPLHSALGDHLHHLLRLLELREQPVDFLHRHAGAGGDPALARGLEDLRPGALARRHRTDDCLETPDRALVDLARLRGL